MTITLRIAVPAIAAALVLSGCGSDSTITPSAATSTTAPTTVAATAATSAAESPAASATPSATAARLPRGAKLFVDKSNGYELALPLGYKPITSKAQLNKITKAGAKAVPGASQQLLNKNLKMLARKSGSNDAINVVVVDADGLTAEQIPNAVPTFKKQIKSIGARSIKTSIVTLGGDPALRAAYTLKAAGTTVSTVQYITAHDGRAYTLTFTHAGGTTSKVEKETAASWQFS